MRIVPIANGATPILVTAAIRSYVHIYNVSDTDIFLSYDMSATDAQAALTTSSGVKLVATTGSIRLENNGIKDMFTRPIYAVHAGVVAKNLQVAEA